MEWWLGRYQTALRDAATTLERQLTHRLLKSGRRGSGASEGGAAVPVAVLAAALLWDMDCCGGLAGTSLKYATQTMIKPLGHDVPQILRSGAWRTGANHS
jgi:hypothetical protein